MVSQYLTSTAPGGYLIKFYQGRLSPEVQHLTHL